MSNSSAHRLLSDHHHHHHHHHHLHLSASGSPSSKSSSLLACQQQARCEPSSTGVGSGSKRGHQRRQSVARLLPDISKLRLLSWLVEASSELINCDIAIMDGVYAKLNRSRESLLFWNTGSASHSSVGQALAGPPATPSVQPVANKLMISQQQQNHHRKLSASNHTTSSGNSSSSQTTRNAAARNHHSLPITNYDASSLAAVSLIAPSSLTSQASWHPRSSNLLREQQRLATAAAASQSTCDSDDNNSNNDDEDDDDDDDDDHSSAESSTASSGIHGTSLSSSNSSNSSAASSDMEFGGHQSLNIGSSTSTSNKLPTGTTNSSQRGKQALKTSIGAPTRGSYASRVSSGGQQINSGTNAGNSAEQLSEKIRRTVMEHNYLQSLLVNIIRQHDRQRDLINQQRRRQMSIDQFSSGSTGNGGSGSCSSAINQQLQSRMQRIDLADIADALDDGCLCSCHSRRDRLLMPTTTTLTDKKSPNNKSTRSNTLPASTSTSTTNSTSFDLRQASATSNQVPSTKVRRLKKVNRNAIGSNSNNSNSNSNSNSNNNSNNSASNNNSSGTNNSNLSGLNELNKQDIINLLSDKLCENCFETHYWLHGSSLELLQVPKTSRQNDSNSSSNQDLNTIISKRNATFIKLVQQEVRSTISKSIELIDLIRKEIKLPESIKQKQLMRCFSTSIQLLTSVGNYVVPAQDISSFITEIGQQQQTTLFSLPSSDFEHLLSYPPSMAQTHANLTSFNHQQQQVAHYHLAQAPDIPLRRRINVRKFLEASQSDSLHNLTTSTGSPIPAERNRDRHGSLATTEHLLSSDLQKLKTSDRQDDEAATTNDSTGIKTTNSHQATTTATTTSASPTTTNNNTTVNDSSSGASSNNSSASSSIARGTVQQSSLTRAQTSSALLDGKTSHDLSFETIANLSRQQTEDDMLFQSRPKFWQSSKFNFIKKLLHVKQQRLLRQQSKDRRIYNNKVQNKFRLVMMDLTHFNKSQQLLTTENGVNSLLTSMRNVLEFGLYLTLKLY